MRYIYRELDADGDGWPEGLGNVERRAWATEKLDNTVYTIRGPARPRRPGGQQGRHRDQDVGDRQGGRPREAVRQRGGTARTPSSTPTRCSDPGNVQVFQRHWIGVTPAEVELKRPGRPDGPAGPAGTRAGARRSGASSPATPASSGCSTRAPGRTAPTTDTEGPACDTAVSSVPAVRDGVHAEHLDHGRGRGGARPDGPGPAASTTRPATPASSSTRRCGSCPGAMPEIAPSPGLRQQHRQAVHRAVDGAPGLGHLRDPLAGRALPARASRPDLGRGLVAVVPQVPDGSAERLRRATSGWAPGASTCGRPVLDRCCGPSYGRATRWRLTHRCRAARGSPVAVGAAGRAARTATASWTPPAVGPWWPTVAASAGPASWWCGCGEVVPTWTLWPVTTFRVPGSWCPPRCAHGSPGRTTRPGRRHAQVRLLGLAAVPATGCSTTGCPRPRRRRGPPPAWPRRSPPRDARASRADPSRSSHARASRPGG